MIQTKFLGQNEFKLFRKWLLAQDADTLALYFGLAVSTGFIDTLIDKILANPDNHHFLVAVKGGKWVGVLHLANVSDHDMEFGIMVDQKHRNQGIADTLMNEAIIWIRNRGFDTLYLHCLNRNNAMKHLAVKHGLELHVEQGDVEAMTHVPPPSVISYIEEALVVQKNIFFMNLQNAWRPFNRVLG